ncbi:hypothetical protein OQ477_00690 [Bacillus sp. ChL18]|uniref:hypothetical protein n=1 Tax=Bacillus sp. ChL18 TaxID=2994534 RepID=UPI00224945C5|nr:hypothetical protein [Bacillus sp. ChL18]MCX2808519.1 hypothetical protein [Bacillus sp. ChL18]
MKKQFLKCHSIEILLLPVNGVLGSADLGIFDRHQNQPHVKHMACELDICVITSVSFHGALNSGRT